MNTPRTHANAHIHLPPNFSAFDTIRQALDLARDQGIAVLGASNYYDFAVYAEFGTGARARGIFPLFGLEVICRLDDLARSGVKINDPGNPGKMYLCGKGITGFSPMNPQATRLMQVVRDNDTARMTAITGALAGCFKAAGMETGLDADAIRARVSARHGSPRGTVFLQERHVARAFQEASFERVTEGERQAFLGRLFGVPSRRPEDAVTVQSEIRAHLLKAGKPAFVPDTFVDFDHAHQLVRALGGIPCYPLLADGITPSCAYEQDVDALIADLKARGIAAAEFIPPRTRPDVLIRYATALRRAGLIVTAGTEHNTPDLPPLAPVCADGSPIPGAVQELFWEGACVVAAHQTLTSEGQEGFVDAAARPHPGRAPDDARIAAFRDLGASLIARCQQGGRGQ